MDDATYEQFFEALDKIVNDDKHTWTEKIGNFNRYMGEREKVNMDELLSWLEDK